MEAEYALSFTLFSLESVAVTFWGLSDFPLVETEQAQRFLPPDGGELHKSWADQPLVIGAWRSLLVAVGASLGANCRVPQECLTPATLERFGSSPVLKVSLRRWSPPPDNVKVSFPA